MFSEWVPKNRTHQNSWQVQYSWGTMTNQDFISQTPGSPGGKAVGPMVNESHQQNCRKKNNDSITVA